MPLVLYSLLLLLFSCSSHENKVTTERVVPVTIETVQRKNVPVYLESIGVVTSPRIVAIRPQVGGKVLAAHVDPGDMVKEGDLLFTIDPRSYQAVLDKAKANLEKDKAHLEYAKKRVERYAELVKKEFVSKLLFDEYKKELAASEAQVLNDEAEVALASINLEHCRITSPLAGKISCIVVDPGNVVAANHQTPFTEIRQISPIYVDFTVPQKELQHMQRTKCREDLKIEVILPHENGDNEQNDSYLGHLIFIDNHVDRQTGTILLQGVVENEEHLLFPGEFVQVRMVLREKENALVVPETAIQFGQRGPFLYVVNEELRAVPQWVALGEKVEDAYIVESGVEEGDKVVTCGHLNLAAGKKVSL